MIRMSIIIKSATIAAISVLVLSGAAQAAKLSAWVSVTVSTPMTVSQTQALDFGAIALVPGGNNTVGGTITIDANSGAIGDPAANGATAGEIRVNVGAPEVIAMTVTVPTSATLSVSGADRDGSEMSVSAITVGTPSMGSGVTGDCSAGCNVISADNGDFAFPLGATLSLADAGGRTPSGSYSGQFTIMAAYQ